MGRFGMELMERNEIEQREARDPFMAEGHTTFRSTYQNL
jgi:hypothetical protein